MPTIGTLVVDVTANTRNLSSGLSRAQSQLQAFGSSATASGRSLTMGLTLPIVGVGVAAVKAAEEAAMAGAQLDAVLKSTGGAANVTAAHVKDYASALQQVTLFDDEAILAGQNLLLTFTGIRNEVGKGNQIFDQATKTLLDMSQAMGTEPRQAAIQLGKALNDPIAGLTALTRIGVSFTEAQKKQIEAMVEAGDVLGAQKLILRELNTEFGGSAEAVAQASSGWQRAWHLMGEAAESVGAIILPTVQKLTAWVASLSERFAALSPRTQQLIVVIGGVAAAIGPLLLVIGKLSMALAVLSAHPIILLAAAVAALGVWFFSSSERAQAFSDAMQKVWETVGPLVTAIGTELLEALQQTWSALQQRLFPALGKVWDAVKKLWEAVGPLIKVWLAIQAVWVKIALEVLPIVVAAVGFVIDILARLSSAFLDVVNWVREHFAEPIVGAIQKVIEWIGNAVGWVKDRFLGAWNAIKGPVIAVLDAIIKSVQKLIGWIQTAVEWIARLKPGFDIPQEFVDIVGGVQTPGGLHGPTSPSGVAAVTPGGISITLHTDIAQMVERVDEGMAAKGRRNVRLVHHS